MLRNPRSIIKSSLDKRTSPWGFDCACAVCERMGVRARECKAARKLLWEAADASMSPKKWAALTGKMRALAVSVPSGAGEAQPHLASLLNLAASDLLKHSVDDAGFREAIALHRI